MEVRSNLAVEGVAPPPVLTPFGPRAMGASGPCDGGTRRHSVIAIASRPFGVSTTRMFTC